MSHAASRAGSHLQELFLQAVVLEELLLELLRVERVGLVDGVRELGLRPIVEFFDLVDLVRVKDVLVANLLQEPTPQRKRLRNQPI